MRRNRLTCIKVSALVLLVSVLALHSWLGGEREEDSPGEAELHSKEGIVALLKELDSHTVRKDGDEGGNMGNDNSLAGERIHGLPNSTREEAREGETQDISIEDILRNIYESNYNQVVRNEDLFGPITNSTVVIVVQVHNRLTYLRQLIVSMSLAKRIEQTLLVFSHDVWDPEINSLVRSIDFAPSLQMFYPFSLQTHPHSFPGESASDCPRDAKPQRAKRMKCVNAHWPDIHGHYREAKFTQTKHHWWWKANQVFHRLDVTRSFTGTVLFLEEDHYVSEDFLHVMELMGQEMERMPDRQIDILCLGTYLRKFNYKSRQKQPAPPLAPAWPHLGGLLHPQPRARRLLWGSSFLSNLLSVFHKGPKAFDGRPQYSNNQKVEVTQWISAKHNMGMAFTRRQWDRISSCSTQFCQYDDYNWDWSLQHVSLNCLQQKLQVMMVKGPRVFHIGECGVHHKKSDCDSSVVTDKVKSILRTAQAYLFPQRLSLVKTILRKKLKLKKGNGGWGDRRDHALCLNMSLGL